VAAFRAACRDGIDPETFWRLTPYQTRLAMIGLRDGRMSLAWQIAALTRQKKLPKLDSLMEKERRRDPADLLDMLKGINRG
jgi:hypothetical protein